MAKQTLSVVKARKGKNDWSAAVAAAAEFRNYHSYFLLLLHHILLSFIKSKEPISAIVRRRSCSAQCLKEARCGVVRASSKDHPARRTSGGGGHRDWLKACQGSDEGLVVCSGRRMDRKGGGPPISPLSPLPSLSSTTPLPSPSFLLFLSWVVGDAVVVGVLS